MCTMLISTQIHHSTMRATNPISSYYQTFVIATPTFFFHFLHINFLKDDSLSLTFFLFFYFWCFVWCTFLTNLIYLFKILAWAPLVNSLHMIMFASQIGYMINLLHLGWILITIIVQQLHRFEFFLAIKKTSHPPPSLGLYVCLYTRVFQWNHLLVNFSNTSPLHHHL